MRYVIRLSSQSSYISCLVKAASTRSQNSLNLLRRRPTMGENLSRGQYEPESLMVTGDLLTFSAAFAVLATMISTCSFVPRGTFPLGVNSAVHYRV